MGQRKRSRLMGGQSSNGSTTSLPATSSPQPSIGRSLTTASGELSATDSKKGSPSSRPANLHEANGSSPTSTTTKQVGFQLDPKTTRKYSSVQVRKSGSWYGSLGRKASASTQVAKETIMGGTVKSGSTADFSRFEARKKQLDGSSDLDAQSTQTMPKIPEAEAQATPPPEDIHGSESVKMPNGPPSEDSSKKPLTGDDAKVNDAGSGAPPKKTVTSESAHRSTPSTGWLGGWFGTSSTVPDTEEVDKDEHAVDTTEQPLPTSQEPAQESLSDSRPEISSDVPDSARPTSSWLGYWWTAPKDANSPQNETSKSAAPKAATVSESPDATVQDATPPLPVPVESQPSAGSTWAFWSRETGSKDSKETTGKPKTAAEQGQLAVIGDRSEASPRQSSGVAVPETTASMKEPPLNKNGKELSTKPTSTKRNKRERPQSLDLDEPTTPRPNTPVNKTSITKPETPGSIKVPSPNLLLPSFRNTYRMRQNPSIIKQITQLLLRTKQPPATHVHLVKDPPKIRKAIAIGVHGLFPASFLRPMIGQPTGTSIRFANHCAEAIRRWADSHGCEDCEIEKVALEGEGKIAERVDNLWKLLLNWIDHIRSADLILVACHSQGVPVGLMLVAKLIDLGIITTARIGICAMAGVSLGPFPDYKSGMGMLMGSAAELWQFADPSSEISQRLEHAMATVLEHGCRLTYVGSIDDQLVPMDSAIYSPASHPYIYRAVFIDGRIHAPDFIAHLVGFALKLRNLGISDQGLVRELSVALAGSLYSGEGHSRLYDDSQVYDLAVSHALETTVIDNVPCRVDQHEGLVTSNPYILPWIMRGLLEEEFVKTELSSETAELLKQFDDWKPVTKALKDIKFRLEAVRSKL